MSSRGRRCSASSLVPMCVARKGGEAGWCVAGGVVTLEGDRLPGSGLLPGAAVSGAAVRQGVTSGAARATGSNWLAEAIHKISLSNYVPLITFVNITGVPGAGRHRWGRRARRFRLAILAGTP